MAPLWALLLGMLLACDRRTPGEATAPGGPAIVSEGIERLDLRFGCGASTCAAWLYLPIGAERPPIVVMAHGFAGTRDAALPYFAERFAGEGMAAFVFDYRHFGASGGSPRQLVDPWSQLDDWHAALAFVRGLDGVDPSRVGIWGTSLGGGHAVVIAAQDPDLRACVAQAPLVDSSLEGEATFYGVRWAIRLVLTGWADLIWSGFGGEAVTIPSIAPGDGFGVIVDDAAHAAFEKLVGPGSTYRNTVVARSIFTFDDYNPGPHLARSPVPTLLVASRADRFTPFAAVEAAARANPNVTIETFEGDHFDVYSPPAREHAAGAAAAFLATHLRRR